MAEVLGLGLSHFPGFLPADMVPILHRLLRSDRVPAEAKDPATWPAAMRAEWADDGGAAFALRHREAFASGVRRLRAALDDFAPDFLLVFGDDQYENFREDIIPPFCVHVFEEVESRPFIRIGGIAGQSPSPGPVSVWGDPGGASFATRGHAEAARYLVRGLMRAGFDIPYSHTQRFSEGLSHAFINTQLFLDWDRTGWRYPVVPFHINAYGSSLIQSRGFIAHLTDPAEDDDDGLPAPSPGRCFQLGEEIARILRASPWRVAVVGSSSWSHANLSPKNHWLYPDVAADRRRFEELRAGDYLAWRNLSLEQIEAAGQHELLNWMPLAGAMRELGQKPSWCEMLESHIMNSCKVMALFPGV